MVGSGLLVGDVLLMFVSLQLGFVLVLHVDWMICCWLFTCVISLWVDVWTLVGYLDL